MLRQLLKQPVLTAVVVLSMAIGIGADTVVLSWIRSLLLNPMPGVTEPNRLAVICTQHKDGDLGDTLSEFDVETLGSERHLFAGVTGSQMGTAMMREGERKDWLWVEVPLANYFEVLGVRPILGRAFLPEEDSVNPPVHAVVISHRLWQQRFQGDQTVIGRTIEMNKQPATIVGVAPPEFRGTMGGLGFDAWIVPALFEERDLLIRRHQMQGWRWLHTVARLATGIDLGSAKAGGAAIATRLAREYPQNYKDNTFAVLPLYRSPWGGQGFFLPLLQALAIAALLLLVLVTANVAHLLLAKAYQRTPEMVVRLALGAPPGRIIRLLLMESMVLALLGGGLGCLIAIFGRNFFFFLMPPTYLPISIEFELDGWVLLTMLAVTLLAGLAFGLAPALHCARPNLQGTLKESGRGSDSSTRHSLRAAFVVSEIALATVLLIGMGLCLRSLEKSRNVDVGLDPNNVIVAGFRIGPNDGDQKRVDGFYARLRREAKQLPGVESAGLADWLPLGFEGGSSTSVAINGYVPAPGESMNVDTSIVSPGYFETLRIALRQGRGFEERDDGDRPLAIVVNETFARRYFGDRNPIGLKVRFWQREGTIVGVAADGKYRQLNEPTLPWLYVNQLQASHRTLTLVVRTTQPKSGWSRTIEQLASKIDPTLAPVAILPFEDFVGAAWAVPRMAATLLSVLGALAWIFAVLGVYAVVNQQAIQRVREMAIRMALGAQPKQILQTILRTGLRFALAGIAAGALAALLLGKMLRSILIGIGPGDALTWLGTIAVLVTAVTAACWLPARRSARVDPMEALK